MVAGASQRREFAEDIAVEAGELAMSYRGRDNLSVRSKGVLDWVTEADLAVERLIRDRIRETFPGDGFFGEEGVDDSLQSGTSSPTWVVDPIDGTTCFVAGLPSWCVSIACLDGSGQPFLGVVRDPSGGETFSALVGDGMTINGRPGAVPLMGITDGLVGVGHPRNASDKPTLDFLKGLFSQGGLFYNSGSAALTMAYVAAGRLVGFFESDLRAWDALAGEVLVRESGGWVTSFMRDGSLSTSKPVLAANPGSSEVLWRLAQNTFGGVDGPDGTRR